MLASYMYVVKQATGRLARDQAEIDRFWNHVREHTDWGPNHIAQGHNPMSIYGDDARYNLAGDKILLIAMSPVLARDNIRCMVDLLVLEPETLNNLFT